MVHATAQDWLVACPALRQDMMSRCDVRLEDGRSRFFLESLGDVVPALPLEILPNLPRASFLFLSREKFLVREIRNT